MSNYTNGKIYVIRNYKNDMVYIGSTIQTLSQRMGKHRSDYKRCVLKNFTSKLYQAFNEYGIGEFYIELLEMFSCEGHEELLQREGHFIREYDSHRNGYNGRLGGKTPLCYSRGFPGYY
jgi:group I intron endonuclease